MSGLRVRGVEELEACIDREAVDHVGDDPTTGTILGLEDDDLDPRHGQDRRTPKPRHAGAHHHRTPDRHPLNLGGYLGHSGRTSMGAG